MLLFVESWVLGFSSVVQVRGGENFNDVIFKGSVEVLGGAYY
jgi:chromosome segregation ATPase